MLDVDQYVYGYTGVNCCSTILGKSDGISVAIVQGDELRFANEYANPE